MMHLTKRKGAKRNNAIRSWAMVMISISMALLAGCAVGPDYQSPDMDMPAAWHTANDPALLPHSELVQQWWSLFNDALLDRLIQTATENNRDLMSAIARVEEARANLGITRGEHWPQLDAQGSSIRQETSDNGLMGPGVEETVYAVGATAGWELDLFGRIRRSVEAAAADYQATAEDRTDVLISLYANVALTYLDIRTYQARLIAANANIDSQRSVLALTRSRYRHGLATALDVAQAERVLAGTEAEVPPLNIGLSQSVNALAVLLGQAPGNLAAELTAPGQIPLPPEKVTVGVPANLLRQRPDVRRAERQLASQTARIGVFKADLYPSFSLTGSLGYESIDAGDLFDAGSRVLSFGPSLRWNIFSGGRIRHRIKAQDARTRQALYGYEQSVLNALREVENALVAYVEDRTRLSALGRSVKASRQSVKLATDLYKQGLVDFQQVLDAQRDQFSFENQLAAARGNSAANFVRLYAALGGGWDPQAGHGLKPPSAQINQSSETNPSASGIINKEASP